MRYFEPILEAGTFWLNLSLLGESEHQVFPFQLHLLAGRNRGTRWQPREKREEGKRGIPGPQCFMWSVCSVVSLRNLLLASYSKSMIHSFLFAGRILIAMDTQAMIRPHRHTHTHTMPFLSQRENFEKKNERKITADKKKNTAVSLWVFHQRWTKKEGEKILKKKFVEVLS